MLEKYLREFANWTITTARYPEAGTGSQAEVEYLLLGLAGEVGEVLNAYKKVLRDNASTDPVIKELADVCWYAARLMVVSNKDWDPDLMLGSWATTELFLLLSWMFGEASNCLDSYSDCYLHKTDRFVAFQDTHFSPQAVLFDALSAIQSLGADPIVVLEAKKAYLLSRTDQGKSTTQKEQSNV